MPHDIRSSDLVRVSVAAFACTIIAACGVRRAGATPTGTAPPCAITLTGARTGTPPCADDRTAVYGIKEKTTMVGFSSNDSLPEVMIAIKFPGMPATKTYQSSDPGAKQGIWVRNGSQIWMAMGSAEDHAVGSYTLTLIAVQEVPYATDAKGYEFHGTLTATLQPDPDTGARGTVTLRARF